MTWRTYENEEAKSASVSGFLEAMSAREFYNLLAEQGMEVFPGLLFFGRIPERRLFYLLFRIVISEVVTFAGFNLVQ